MHTAVRHGSPRRWAAAGSAALVAAALLVAYQLNTGFHMRSCTVGGHPAKCGLFPVAENPGQPDGKKIKLRVAVFEATGQHPRRDPLVWFSGWGGAGVTDDAAAVIAALRRVNVDRDLVFVDQRGTGGSKLVCAMPAGWDASTARSGAVTRAARRCAADIGPNLRFYTSAVAVDDVDRVRQALGYDKVNIYGGSYGVTTGQIYLLRHGRHVRSAVFDSGSLLDVHIFERSARAYQRALDLLFHRCAADTFCSTAYPDLRREYKALLARLAREPIALPEHGRLTPRTFAAGIEELIAYSPGKNLAPRIIDLVAHGRIAEAGASMPSNAAGAGNSELTYKLLIQCSEPWASWRPGEVARLGRGTDLGAGQLLNAKSVAAVCKGLPKGVAPPGIGRRVRSSVPVLFLNGNEDPADPPSNVAYATRELPNSRTVIFQHAGHGQLGMLCAQNLIADFVARGGAEGLDASCARTAVQQAFDVAP